MCLTRRTPGVPVCLFRPYPLPFSPPFLLYCSLPFLFFYVFFIDLYLLLFRRGLLSVVFRTVATCFWPAVNLECPCLFSDLIPFPFLLLFSYLFLTLPFLLCLFHWSISAVALSSSLFSSFSSILFRTLPVLLCLFHWSISAVVSGEAFYLLIICCFPHCSHMFLTRREPGVPLSLFRPYPLPFSHLFLLYCSLPFLFLCLFHWSISAVVSGEAFYLLFSPL